MSYQKVLFCAREYESERKNSVHEIVAATKMFPAFFCWGKFLPVLVVINRSNEMFPNFCLGPVSFTKIKFFLNSTMWFVYSSTKSFGGKWSIQERKKQKHLWFRTCDSYLIFEVLKSCKIPKTRLTYLLTKKHTQSISY